MPIEASGGDSVTALMIGVSIVDLSNENLDSLCSHAVWGERTDPKRETRKPSCGFIAMKNGWVSLNECFLLEFIFSPVYCSALIVTL